MAKDTIDFSFDETPDFFGVNKGNKEDKTNVETVVANVKKAGTTIDEDDDDDDENETPTNLENTEPDEEEEEDISTVFKKPAKNTTTDTEAGKNKDKAKPKAKAKDEEENEEEEEEEEIPFESKKQTPKKKDEDEGKQAAIEEARNKKKEEEVEEDPIDDEFFADLATEMKNRGILSVELPKGKKTLTEDEFIELQEEELEARVNETIDSFKDLDEEGKRFLQYKLKGGDTASFIMAYKGTGINYDKLDFKKEADVDKVLNFYLKNVDGKDEDEIAEYKQWLTDGGKKAVYAEKYANKLKKMDEQRRKDFEAKQAERVNADIANTKKFLSEFTEVLSKTDKIGNFVITEKEKKELKSYMVTPTVKVGKNEFLPQVHVDIAKIMEAKTEKDKKNFILLSKLIKSNFDFSSIMPAVQTAVTQEARTTLRRNKNNPRGTTSGSYSKKALADLFVEDDD